MADADETVATVTTDYSDFYAKADQVVANFRIPGTPAWIILCGYNIGETSAVCALAEEFVKAHGHGIILVVTPKHESVARMYAHRFLKIFVIADNWMHCLLRSGYIPQDRFELDQPLSGCWIDLGFRHSDGIKYLGRYPGRGGISETDLWRFVLRLPWNAKLEPPRIDPLWEDQAWQLAKTAGVAIGRSVLLCPINNSLKTLPDIFWKTVAARLIENGYKVFTNMGGLNQFNGPPTMPVEGTVAVNLPIHLVMPFINLTGRAISGINGMSFFTMIAGYESMKMTILLVAPPDNTQEHHASLGFNAPLGARQFRVIGGSMQYLAPELCLKTPFDEYLICYEESTEEYMRLAVVVADQNTDDPSCIKRYEINGNLFVHEHADWLKELV